MTIQKILDYLTGNNRSIFQPEPITGLFYENGKHIKELGLPQDRLDYERKLIEKCFPNSTFVYLSGRTTTIQPVPFPEYQIITTPQAPKET